MTVRQHLRPSIKFDKNITLIHPSMPIPGKRRSRSKKRRGWAHRALAPLTLTRCSHCGKPTVPHQACRWCGRYRGRTVVTMGGKREESKKKMIQTETAQ